MSRALYIIEKRREDGSLDFTGPQPEKFFGMKGITGITEDEMAKVVFRHVTDATLDGRELLQWPAKIDPAFSARRKTW